MKLNAIFRKSVVALALAGACGMASATVSGVPVLESVYGSSGQSFDLGTLANYSLWGLWHAGIGGSVIDTISFTLTDAASFSLSYGSMFFSGMSDITNASIMLDGNTLASLSGANTPDFFGTELQLGAGSHSLSISNAGALMFGGSYQLQMAVSPVPEPESWALMLGGLGLLGAVARRRSARQGN